MIPRRYDVLFCRGADVIGNLVRKAFPGQGIHFLRWLAAVKTEQSSVLKSCARCRAGFKVTRMNTSLQTFEEMMGLATDLIIAADPRG